MIGTPDHAINEMTTVPNENARVPKRRFAGSQVLR